MKTANGLVSATHFKHNVKLQNTANILPECFKNTTSHKLSEGFALDGCFFFCGCVFLCDATT